MLNIYKNDAEGRLREQSEIVHNSWVRLTEPTEKERQLVTSRLGVLVDFIHDPLDASERSRVQIKEDHVSLVIHVPLTMEERNSVPYRTVPLGIIHTNDALVTTCRIDHPILSEICEQQAKYFSTQTKIRFILQLFYLSARHYLNAIDDIDQKITFAEKRLQKSIHNKEVYKLLNLNKSLVYFAKALKVNRTAIQQWTRAINLKMDENDERMLQDVLIETQQALVTSEIHNTNLSNLMDAYSAVIENNVNVTVKRLTMFTLIAAIPMVIAGVFGMNIPLPIQNESYTFALLMSISAVISLLTGWVFKKLNLF